MVWHITRANILLIVNVILTDRVRMSLNTHQKKKDNCQIIFFCSGIIKLLFDGLAYNTSGHFAHCSYFSEPRIPRNSQNIRTYYMLSNKVYVF